LAEIVSADSSSKIDYRVILIIFVGVFGFQFFLNELTSEDDIKLVQQIMECIGDKDMMLIINNVMNKSKLVSEILKSCKLPQTSGYRKINKLVDLGLLIISGYDIGTDGRHMFKYTTSFESINVFMEKGKSKVKVKPKKIGKNNYVSIPFVKKS